MSGLVGRGSRSFKKKIVEQSLIPALGIKKVKIAFEVTVAAMTPTINLLAIGSFNTQVPTDLSGFSNPSSTEISSLRLSEFANNITVQSNLNGVLVDQVTYRFVGNSIEFLNGYSVDAAEYFIILVGSNPVTGNRIVDARPLRASGDVDFSGIGSAVVDFSTGQGFRVAGSTINSAGDDNQQIGNVQVFVDGVLQFRNAGNGDEDSMAATDQTGNYREIALSPTGTIIAGVDYANAVRFNMGQPFSSTEGVLVVATNLIVDEPNGTGLLSRVENVEGEVNSLENALTTPGLGMLDNIANVVESSPQTGQLLTRSGSNWVNQTLEVIPPSQQLNLIQALGMRRTTPEAPSGTPSTASVQSFTWQVPDGVDNIFVIMAGAGSSGGGGVSNGGAAGAFFQDWLRVVPGQTYNIQVGDGSVRADGGNTSHEVGGSTFIEGTTTALIDGQTSVRIQASGAPFSSASGGTTGNVSFSAGTNTYTVPANLNNIDGGVNTTRFFSSNVLGGFLPAFGKLQDSDWNDVMFRTTGSGTAGGDTAIAARVNPADQSGTGQGGGGAGFLQGETPAGVQGFGRASGPGGIRIGWYSNSEFAPAHPLVTV